VVPKSKLAYHWYNETKSPMAGQAGGNMEILVIAAATLTVVWIIVLWGSRYFGPR
jgi:hypothetical protein